MTPSTKVLPVTSPSTTTRQDRCRFCGAVAMRRSRWRSEDFGALLTGRWPMRCMDCRKRQYGMFTQARRAVAAGRAHSGEFKSDETWGQYTARERERR